MGEGKKPRWSGRQLKVFTKSLVSFYVHQKKTYGPWWLKAFIHSQPPSNLPLTLCGCRGSSFSSQNVRQEGAGCSYSSFVRVRSLQSNPDKMGFLLFLMAAETILQGSILFAHDLDFSLACRGYSVTLYLSTVLAGGKPKCQIWHLEALW